MKALATLLVVAMLLTAVLLAAQSTPESADLVLTNARVIDGTGAVYNRATIAINGEDDHLGGEWD